MVFSETTNRTGIVQLLEDLTSTQSATTSSYTLAVKTRDINLAFDDYQNLVKRVAGSWQADDSNHTKYPNMTFNLVSGQKDYNFTVDEQGNQVQDIYRVEAMDPTGKWYVLKMVNEMNYEQAISAIDTYTGSPTEYYITANGIFLVYASNYNQTGGIRMFFTRSPSYFLSTDTTKIPGIPNGHHRYLALCPAYWYWMPKDNQRASIYKNELTQLENNIKHEYANRMKDETLVMESECVNPY